MSRMIFAFIFALSQVLACPAFAGGFGPSDYLILEPGSLPSDGRSGEIRFDSSSNTLQVYKESTGAWSSLGGGGSSGINYYPDEFADDTSNVTPYDDGAATPVDGTGGTVDGATVSAETTNPLEIINDNNDQSYKLSKDAADRQGEGWALETDALDRIDTVGQSVLTVQFAFETDSTYEAGDIKVYTYRVGSNTLEACSGRTVGGDFSNELGDSEDGGTYTCEVTVSSSDTSVRLLMHIATTEASAYDVVVDKIRIGPDRTVTGPIVGECEAFTPTGSWTTATTYTGVKCRSGDQMYVDVTADLSGAPNSTALTIDIPDGKSIDTDKLSNSTLVQNAFHSNGIADDSSGFRYPLFAAYNDTTSVRVRYWRQDNETDDQSREAQVSQSTPVTFASGDRVQIRFRVPIEGWDSGQAISTTQADHLVPKASMTLSSDFTHNSSGGWLTVPFDTAEVDRHGMTDTTNNTIEIFSDGRYKLCLSMRFVSNTTGVRALRIEDSSNNTLVYKQVGADQNTSTDFSHCREKELSAGTILNAEAFQGSGGNLDIQATDSITFFQVTAVLEPSSFSVTGKHERLEAEITADTTESTGAWADVTGGSVSHSEGTFKIGYNAEVLAEKTSAGAVLTGCRLRLTDGSNSALGETSSFMVVNLDNTQFQDMMHAEDTVTFTSSGTVKLRLFGDGGTDEQCTVNGNNGSSNSIVYMDRVK